MKGNINKQRRWRIWFAAFLLGISCLLYILHFLIFKDARHIFIYLLGDIAFVPISVLLVTLVLEQIMESKQKEMLLHKLNMVLGTFFSEMGNPLLRIFESFWHDNPDLKDRLQIKKEWTYKDFCSAKDFLTHLPYLADAKKTDLVKVCVFLTQKRPFMLTLLENPNLLEHDKITDMLWAIFHLTEELMARKNLRALGDNDLEHLSGDIKRACDRLLLEWLDYMQHLSHDYPYLYSLAVRTNPFNPEARPEII